jgi:hypothetical protein
VQGNYSGSYIINAAGRAGGNSHWSLSSGSH